MMISMPLFSCNLVMSLVLLTLLLALALSGLGADLLVVLLEGGKILTRLGELALLHALAHIPVHEGVREGMLGLSFSVGDC